MLDVRFASLNVLNLLRVVVAAMLLAVSCTRVEPTPDPAVKTTQAPPTAASTTNSSPLVLARGVRFVKAGADNDVPKLVRSEREKAVADGRDLIVYVGAKWCEPCQRFHQAAQRGELDGEFPELTILEFDLDEDRDRITAAGYMSKLIPLFVMPEADGRASTERRFEGGVKGERAVANITPRLKKLLTK
jgi:thiol-disulfide isomerase/thioredoxin